MSSIMAPVENGKIVDGKVETAADSAATRKVNNSMDKEAFLQLLVAQMQYQDPLEPTSNTEYVAQLATFSELEAMTNLNEAMSISRASQLIGQKVLIQTTSATTGDITETSGTVDSVVIENNKAYLVINGKPYSIDDLAGIMTDEYWEKYKDLLAQETSTSAETITAAIASLPKDLKEITLEKHGELVKAIRKAFNELSPNDRKQVPDDALVKLVQAENVIVKLEIEQQNRDWEKYKDLLTQDTPASAETIAAAIASLPNTVQGLTLEKHADLIKAIRKAYDKLSPNDRMQISDSAVVKLVQAEEAIAKMENGQKENEEQNSSTDIK